MDLLNAEISFNASLGTILERFGAIQQTLDAVRRATLDGDLTGAVQRLKQADEAFMSLSAAQPTKLFAILEGKVTELRNYVKEKLRDRWKYHILIDATKPSICVRQESEGEFIRSLSSNWLMLTYL